MHFIHATVWDKGKYCALNQDSFSLQTVYTGNGPYAMIALCDGGNYGKEAIAGGYAVRTMTEWFYGHGLELLCRNASGDRIYRSCRRALTDIHLQLQEMAKQAGNGMGTGFMMLILTVRQYFYVNASGGGCYRICGKKNKILCLHDENSRGTKEILGVEEFPTLIYKSGNYKKGDRFFLCSDGLDRCGSVQGIKALGNNYLSKDEIEKLLREMIIRGRQRGEKDSCTGIVIGRN